MNIKSMIGLTSFFIGLAIAFTFLDPNSISKIINSPEQNKCMKSGINEKFWEIIENEIMRLQVNEHLIESLREIKSYKLSIHSHIASAILAEKRRSLSASTTGKYEIELEFIDLLDNEKTGVIIQISIFELTSKNKVGEVDHTIYISDLN